MIVLQTFGNVFDLNKVMQQACIISIPQLPKLNGIDIFAFNNICKDNFTYKADENEQIVKTWKNALETKTIDCKSYSVFAKCFYLLQNQKANFCFLGQNQNFRHVCCYLPNLGLICDLLTNNILYSFDFYTKKYKFTDVLIL